MRRTIRGKPIRFIVPHAPGGGADSVCRSIARRLQETPGQPLVVENPPGASEIFHSEAIAKAAADGYTTEQINCFDFDRDQTLTRRNGGRRARACRLD